jgi:hypothetical protein
MKMLYANETGTWHSITRLGKEIGLDDTAEINLLMEISSKRPPESPCCPPSSVLACQG